MTAEYASIEVKSQGTRTIVQGIGRTGRGQRYIKKQVVIEFTTPSDPATKAQIAEAVAQLFPQSPSPT